MSFPKPAEWIEALEAAATEVVTTGGAELPEFDSRGAPMKGGPGAFISLVGDGHSVRLGIVGSEAALARLAGLAIMSELEPDEFEDATCELANVIAGNVRKLLNSRAPGLRLGLPVYSVRPPPTDRYQVAHTELKLDDVSAQLLVMMPKPA